MQKRIIKNGIKIKAKIVKIEKKLLCPPIVMIQEL